jgi:ADP-L-glycero-D-manno-heptose 6-epimerase
MRKVIITGSKGFIGKNLIDEIKDNFEILEINEDIFENEDWTNHLSTTLNKFSPDVIFHIGACSDTLEQDVNYMMTRNYESTKIMSDYCYVFNCKMIYSSSAANYGTNNLYPSNLYGWSKYVAEQYVIKNGGIGLRYFNVYGPLEDHKGKMSSVAYQMLEKQKEGQEIKIFPKKPKRDFVYVKDVVNANLYALDHYYGLNSKWYEVGSGDARTFEDVLDILDIDYAYHGEDMIPKGYQFFTKSDKNKWMNGWEPIFKIDNGLIEYKKYLNGTP